MRMWMVNPKILCRKHLLGEHLECHIFEGAIKKGKNLNGYINNNLFEPYSLTNRHDELALELLDRGYIHQSLIDKNILRILFCNYRYYNNINSEQSLKDLLKRCPECKKRYFLQNNK